MLENLKQFWPYVKPYRKKYIIAAAALLVVDLLDNSLPLVIKYALDHMDSPDAFRYLLIAGILYPSMVATQGFLRFWWRYLFYTISFSVGRDLRNQFYTHLQKLSMNFFHNARTGDIMSRATNDIEAVRQFFGEGSIVILDISFYLITVPFYMLYLSPTLMLVTVGCSLVLPFFVYRIGQRLHKKSTEVQESMSDITQAAEENFSGVRVVKSFAQEQNQFARFRRTNETYFKKNMSMAKTHAFFHPVMEFVPNMTKLLNIGVGAYLYWQGTITIGDLVAFIFLMSRIIWPMAGSGFAVSIYQRASASMNRLMEVFNVSAELPDTGARKAPETSNIEVEFRHVNFGHRIPEIAHGGIPRQNDVNVVPALKNINLKMPANKTIAITGPIGSGKTTLLNLLCRFYDPTAGEILINGVNAKEYSIKELRSMMGFVPQDIFLYSDTIKENIAFGLESGAEVSERDLGAVAQAVDMRDAIESLPDKYGAYLGERGINLSGGQRQRMSLARALMKNPSLLVLDDCFSAVDYETERKILKNIIENKVKSQTVIVVSHRLAVMSMADVIVFMDKGEIVEQGTHQELLAKGGAYAKFSEYQSAKEKLEEV